MRTRWGNMLALAFAALTFVAWACSAALAGTPGSPGDTTADHVLGQVDFTKTGLNMVDASGLNVAPATVGPAANITYVLSPPFRGVAIDRHSTPNHIYQADSNNSRVLGWKDANAFTNGGPADLVIGQPDFYSFACNGVGGAEFEPQGVTARSLCYPTAVAADSAGNVYVSDYGNNRVLEYKDSFAACAKFPCVTGAASVVLGQGIGRTAFASNNRGTGGSSFGGPTGIAVDKAGNVFVADTGNSRVLEYRGPIHIGSGPYKVFGQPGFSSGKCNGGTAPGDVRGVGADSLCEPLGIAIDSAGNLWVADYTNNRVLEYDNPSASPGRCRPGIRLHNGCAGDTVADRVFGQLGSFVSNQELETTSADSLFLPADVAVDAAGNVYIANWARTLEYDNPLALGGGTPGRPGSAGDTTADRVFGQQGDFTERTCTTFDTGLDATADSFCLPGGLAIDNAGDLFAVDEQENRLLEYFNPLAPTGGNPGSPGFAGDTTADKVLGQPRFDTVAVNMIDARSIAIPYSWGGDAPAVAIDANSTPHHLYVADTYDNRVLGWIDAKGFENGAPADIVIGQPNFNSYGNNDGSAPGDVNGVGSDSLWLPSVVAVDPSGNLWVGDADLVDRDAGRLMEYPAPFASGVKAGEPASRILGHCGGGFNSNNCTSVSAQSLSGAGAVAFDAKGNLYVADGARVLEYDAPIPPSGDISANRVFGQHGSFTSNDCVRENGQPTIGADSLCGTIGIAIDRAGNVYIVDMINSVGRVLEYDNPLAPGGGTPGVSGSAGDTTADRVFGEPDFSSVGCNSRGDFVFSPTPDTLCRPNSVAVDSAGNLYIGDLNNTRVLEYHNPVAPGGGTPGVPGSAGDTTADTVFGQNGSFYTNNRLLSCVGVSTESVIQTTPNADTLCAASGLALDPQGDLFLADTGNSRILEYDQPLADTPFTPARAK